MEIGAIGPTPRQSSFPFLLVTALLFYFFSKSPGTPDTQARAELERALDRRKSEIVGLKAWLNSSNLTNPEWDKEHLASNLTFERVITANLCYLQNQTFGLRTPHDGQQFISEWLQDVDRRANVETPRLFWRNITGHIKGQWRLRTETIDWYPPGLQSNSSISNLTENKLYISQAAAPGSPFDSQRGHFPWTSGRQNESGTNQNKWSVQTAQRIGYNLRESLMKQMHSNATMIRGSMYFSAPNSKDVALDVEGIHFQNRGIFYLRAWPDGSYFDTRVHLSSALDIPSDYHVGHQGNESMLDVHPPTPQQAHIGEVILADLGERTRKVQSMLKKGDIPHDDDNRGGSDNDLSANCTFLIYGSLTPLATTLTQTVESLLEYENSLTIPSGASVSVPFPARPIFQALMISPNCGLVMETNEMTVLMAPVFWSKGRMYGYVAGLVLGLQCWLLVWQMDSRQSPSSLSRMSYLALVTQIIMDAWAFSSHLTLSVVTNNSSSQALLVPAFFACLNAILFGMRYGTLIRMHPPAASRSSPDSDSTGDTIGRDADYVQVPNAGSDQLVSETPPTGSPSLVRESLLHRLVTIFRNLVANRPIVSITVITLSLVSIPFLLYSWQPMLLWILYSYWIPQIAHNVQHGTSRRGLRKRYVLGTTLCRLYLPLYVWACPRNALFVDPNPWIWLLPFYSLLQAAILILQDYLGARFFLFGACLSYEPIWDYHPVRLPNLGDLENGRTDDGMEKMPECVICFEPIDVVPSSPSIGHDERQSSLMRSTDVGLFSRWSYMVPPCRHIAHTKCLENWLAIKSECPVCRRALPPI